jgi:UPF0042 nucleotide-binding protein
MSATIAAMPSENPASETPAPEIPTSETGHRQRLLLVMGLLGAGKTTVLRELEDRGWEAIDNFPVRLLERLLDSPRKDSGELRPPLAIGFDSRTRGFRPEAVTKLLDQLAARDDLDLSTLFLECSDRELERRYNETRRRHPLAGDSPVSLGIQAERELLEPVRRASETIVDTSEMTSNGLQQVIRERFSLDEHKDLTVTISSFGFSRGMPPLADLVFDMRFLDNPHWDPQLRPLTGRDAQVGEHIRRDPAYEEAFVRIRDLLLMLLPRYLAQGKAYVHIAFGCTGGRHRSVFMAEEIANVLRGAGFSPTLLHRNLPSRAVDPRGKGAA